MDYKRHYNLLIERAKQRSCESYTERHHIVPRCLGGSNKLDNLVNLYPEEHYIAHQLLVKIHPNNKKLLHAAIMMIPATKDQKRNNKLYSWLKKKYSIQRKIDTIGDKNPTFGKKWYYNPETLEKILAVPDTQPDNYILGRSPNVRKRYCRHCNVYVDTVHISNGKLKFCNDCKKNHKKKRKLKYDYNIISLIYKEGLNSKQGYYTIAERYGINKWSIYDYIERYKDRLEKEFGV